MATANDFPTIEEFKVVSSIGSITFTVEFDDPHFPGGLPYLQTEVFEFYLSDTDDFGAATKVAQGLESAKAEGLDAGTAKYAWLRPRRKSISGSGETVYTYGPVHPGTGGGVDDPGTPGSGVEVQVYSDNEQWVDYTPSLSASAGSLGTITDVGGRYKRRGTSAVVQAYATFDNGTGSNGITFSAPLPAKTGIGGANIGVGISSLGMCWAKVTPPDLFLIALYDGSHPVSGSGQVIEFQAEYELV